ncbi:methyltransferase family protein [Rhodopila globiformis]|uniref:Isoprenylcysteine carboxyl methyltransferase n=1 Tax=Rhodopila globiformis TaxID=1071 RepID=A0A2S6NJH9_RHOGL|nr:isoprenylcysteine carboxylmethyltransferase family protein [Rhodopila globiformis]PPQ34842.1 isoprenylcysteine carboxyl methyltransferase [Rhodopila globiformis]
MLTPAIRLLLVVGGTVLYLALAIIAYGGIAAFFSQPALVALAAIVVLLSVAGYLAGGNVSPGEREDRGNRWVLIAFGILLLLDVFLPPWADSRDVWTLDGDTIRWIGVALFAAGGAVRLWPVYVLGDRFSGLVAIQKGHRLVTGGIYGVIRHPSYLGMLVNSLGWALAFRSIFGVLLTAALLVPLHARIEAEERLLVSQFGTEYDAYRRRTSRLVPRLY